MGALIDLSALLNMLVYCRSPLPFPTRGPGPDWMRCPPACLGHHVWLAMLPSIYVLSRDASAAILHAPFLAGAAYAAAGLLLLLALSSSLLLLLVFVKLLFVLRLFLEMRVP